MLERIKRIISQNQNEFTLLHKATEAEVSESEEKLGIAFPDELKEVLVECGHIEGYGVEINGVTDMVNDTLFYREREMPLNYLVLCNCDEFLYCVSIEKNKYSVVLYDYICASVIDTYETIDDCLVELFEEAKADV